MRVYLACFDIEDDRNRRKLGDLLLTYGDRVQHSVFEISVKDEGALEHLCRQCESYVEETDSLRFYWLNKESRSKSRDIWGEPIAQFPAAILL
ncbi:MAG: CRISPR-associated endonuclease Cas2 [Gammaproteobacteria bacterium]|nr:MAG: CRISPR-associated endonuclease Cas2 [Gammaproteobacteria bacterium]